MISKQFIENIKNLKKLFNLGNRDQVILGRWKLKNEETIDKFYNPDPGYPNNYGK